MRIVLTGASGHIGNNLVRYIEEREDAEIVALTRRKIGKELDGTKATQIVGDLFDEAFLSEHIRAGDTVVHLAGFIDLTDKKKEQTYKVNFDLTKTVVEVCKKRGVARFIYAGSVDGIYKDKAGKITEPDGYDEQKIEGNYGKSKALAMGLVLSEIQNNPDFNAAMVIPSAVVGIHDYKPSAVGGVLCGVLRGKAEFGVNGGYNFVGVKDVCAGVYALIKNDARGQYILSGENVTVKELYEIVNRAKGYKRKPIILPIWLVKLFLPFVKVLSKITLKTLCEPHDYSCEKAKADLGFSPTPAKEVILETLAWFEENPI